MLLARADRFSTGLAPNLPFLLLCAAALWRIWYQLRVRSSDLRSPLLPRGDGLTALPSHDRFGVAGSARTFLNSWGFGFLALAALFTCQRIFREGVLSLEGRYFDITYSVAAFAVLAIMLNSVFGAWFYWRSCRQLLIAIDRTPLRYAVRSIRGFSWRRVWGLGSAEDSFAFRPLVRSVEALHRLLEELEESKVQIKHRQTLEYSCRKLEGAGAHLRKLTDPSKPIFASDGELSSFSAVITANQDLANGIKFFQHCLPVPAVLTHKAILEDYWRSKDKRWVTRETSKAADKDNGALLNDPPDA